MINKLAGSKFVVKHAVPIDLGPDMVVHCAMEVRGMSPGSNPGALIQDVGRYGFSQSLITCIRV